MEGERIRAIIGIMVVAGFLGVIAAWFIYPVKGDPATFNLLLGFLGNGALAVVMQYFFGNSANGSGKANSPPPAPVLPPEHT